MKKPITLGLFAAILVALVYAFVSRHDFSDHEHENFQNALWKLKELDGAFTQNVLSARFSLLNTYDDFEDNRRAADETMSQLEQVPAFVDARARGQLRDAFSRERALLERRDALIEQFKSQNAIVSNSRRYLPLAVGQLGSRLEGRPGQRELEAIVDDLTRSLLALGSASDAASDQALATIEEMEAWLATHRADTDASSVAGLARHARTLVDGTRKLDALTEQILALQAAREIENLMRVYQVEVMAALERTQHYRVGLYVLGGLITAGLGLLLLNLRGSNRRLEEGVLARTAELAASEERFRTLATSAPIGIFLADSAGQAIFTNPRWRTITGLSEDEALGDGWRHAVHPDDAPAILPRWTKETSEGHDFAGEFRFRTPAGEVRSVMARSTPVRSKDGAVRAHVGTVEDVTERKRIADELSQAQKLESVGRLAAGVAHEINTPVQFVNDSCFFVKEGLADLQGLVATYRQTLEAVAGGTLAAADGLEQARRAEEAADLEYLSENLQLAAERSLEGLDRVATIVRSMKEFSHPDQREQVATDLNKAILNTLLVARSEYKYVAELDTELDELPPVPCFVGDFNQAVLNIVVNAAHAIADRVQGTDDKGRITVRTRCEGEHVLVSIQDTGGGIPASVQGKIFDPFFTTKEVGRGTGQGLAIARSVVVDKHHGTLSFDSRHGDGTTFNIRLPVRSARPATEGCTA